MTHGFKRRFELQDVYTPLLYQLCEPKRKWTEFTVDEFGGHTWTQMAEPLSGKTGTAGLHERCRLQD